MPGSSRESQVDLSVTPYYHCIGRCVRRAFLCGEDEYSGENYDHRKGWFLERMKVLAEVFAIDICAFAVMSNHFHTVLRVALERAMKLTDEAVLRRYGRLFPFVVAGIRELPEKAQAAQLAILRERLTDISWFMRCLNEHVARRANKEDKCTGRFWEGRFKSQALLDEGAVLACMSYVDLNPVRAAMASTLAGSDFTSIQQRIREVGAKRKAANEGRATSRMTIKRTKAAQTSKARLTAARTIPLAPFRGAKAGKREPLPIRYEDYLALLKWTGRVARRTAAGAEVSGKLSDSPPVLLTKLQINPDAWLQTMTKTGLATGQTLGSPDAIDAQAERSGKRWLKGKTAAKRLFLRAS